MAAEWLWVDGQQAAMVPADDRGLLLADGVFETIRIERRRPSLSHYHLARLVAGLGALNFPHAQHLAQESLERVLGWGCAHTGHEGDAVLRLSVTRGSGPRGYAPPNSATPRVIARLNAGLPKPCPHLRLSTVAINWPDQPYLAGLKLLARTEQILAIMDAQQKGFDDALMRDAQGRLISTASGNLFFRLGDRLITPALTQCGIAGTRREHIITVVGRSCGYSVEETVCELGLLDIVNEVFTCNAISGIRSVASIAHGGQAWSFDDQSAVGRLAPHIHLASSLAL